MSAATAPFAARLAGWSFGALLVATAVATLLLVHPVPAIGYVLASLLYLPPATDFLQRRFGLRVHPLLQAALGVAILMFTLGVSDLGDMLDGSLR